MTGNYKPSDISIFATVGGREIPREDDEGSPFTVDLGTVLTFATGADHMPHWDFLAHLLFSLLRRRHGFSPQPQPVYPPCFFPFNWQTVKTSKETWTWQSFVPMDLVQCGMQTFTYSTTLNFSCAAFKTSPAVATFMYCYNAWECSHCCVTSNTVCRT